MVWEDRADCYFLTKKGGEQFPSRYLSLTTRLLEQLERERAKGNIGRFVDANRT